MRPRSICHWHLNGTHYLEQWGDTRTFDGTVSFIQPLIAPLYGGHSESELIEFLTNENEASQLRADPALLAGDSTPARISRAGGTARCTMALWRVRPLRPRR